MNIGTEKRWRYYAIIITIITIIKIIKIIVSEIEFKLQYFPLQISQLIS